MFGLKIGAGQNRRQRDRPDKNSKSCPSTNYGTTFCPNDKLLKDKNILFNNFVNSIYLSNIYAVYTPKILCIIFYILYKIHIGHDPHGLQINIGLFKRNPFWPNPFNPVSYAAGFGH